MNKSGGREIEGVEVQEEVGEEEVWGWRKSERWSRRLLR